LEGSRYWYSRTQWDDDSN